jgi:hypothetical protein
MARQADIGHSQAEAAALEVDFLAELVRPDRAGTNGTMASVAVTSGLRRIERLVSVDANAQLPNAPSIEDIRIRYRCWPGVWRARGRAVSFEPSGRREARAAVFGTGGFESVALPPVDRLPDKIWSSLPLWRNLFLVWTVHSLIFAQQSLTLRALDGASLDIERALLTSFGTWMPWVPFGVFVIWLVRHYPLERGRRMKSLFMLGLGAVLTIVGKAVMVFALNDYIGWYAQTPPVGRVLIASAFNNILLYWLLVVAAHALLYAARFRQRDAELAEVRASLSEARLQALSAQLNPHFLFNTLNAVAELVHHDAAAADRMLVGLATLLRCSLDNSADQEVPLREEMAMLEQYLAIQRVRFGERLRTRFAVDADCLDAKVPFLVLQPLVENAIVHGISARVDGGDVLVSAGRRGGRLRLVVENSAASLAELSPGSGIGLRNTADRLQCLYGDRYSLVLDDVAGGVTRVAIELPFARARRENAGAA